MKITLRILVPALFLLITSFHTVTSAQEEQEKPAQKETQTSSIEPSKASLSEILEKHYEARGGKEAWDKVKTLKFTGVMLTNSATFKTAAVFKRPDLCRLDFQAGNLYFMESYDGDIAWQMNPTAGRGPEILKGKRAKELQDTCDFEGPLIEPKRKGHKVKLLGEQEIQGQMAYVLQVDYKSGNTDKFYLDTESYLPFMVKGTTTIQDKTVETTVKVSEYIDVDDIMIPFSYEFIVDGNPDTETLQIKTISLNTEMEHSIFTLPKRPQDLR